MSLTTGRFTITKVEPQASGESSKVKVKVKINKNGILSVPSASMIEKVESATEEQGPQSMETEPPKEGEASQDAKTEVSITLNSVLWNLREALKKCACFTQVSRTILFLT